MTNEEAIERLKVLTDYEYDADLEALEAAIKALEQQPSDSNISDPCDGCQYELNSTNGNPCYSCGKYKLTEQQPCEDCISREAVEKITWEEPSYDDALNVLTEVRDKVRALPSVTPQQTRWIPVSERLPEEDGEYLLFGKITDEDKNCIIIGEYYAWMEKFGIWQERLDIGIRNLSSDFYEYESVKAWMPLPQPYKADRFWFDDYKNGNLDEYTRGLNDAWECARKLVHPDRGGLSTNAKIAICGKPDSDYILLEYSAADAITKIKEFEESEQRMAEHRKMIKEYIAKYGREAFDELVESIKNEEETE